MDSFGLAVAWERRSSAPFATSPLHPDGEEQLSPFAQGHADPIAFIGELDAELEEARPRIAALSRILFCKTMDIRLSLGVRLVAIPAPRHKVPRA